MSFRLNFSARAEDIDELGHVNNAVWVRWAQALAVGHWAAIASAADQAACVWVVTRHAIDYRGNLALGAAVTGETWVADGPRGARFDRRFRFTGDDGRVLVEGVTTWALLDRASGRLMRVRPAMAALFVETGPGPGDRTTRGLNPASSDGFG